jgi:hypothetical protein
MSTSISRELSTRPAQRSKTRGRGAESSRLNVVLAALRGVAFAVLVVAVSGIATGTTVAGTTTYTYDGPTNARVEAHEIAAPKAAMTLVNVLHEQSVSPSVDARGAPTTYSDLRNATEAVDDVFHYTKGEFVDSISTNGLRPGSYATPNGGLSPLQAQIDLALPPNTGLRDAVMRVDVAGLREAGYEIPAITRVTGMVTGPGGRVYTMPGGGYEMQFPYAIPPAFIKVVTS